LFKALKVLQLPVAIILPEYSLHNGRGTMAMGGWLDPFVSEGL
jgi:hypothetical protein